MFRGLRLGVWVRKELWNKELMSSHSSQFSTADVDTIPSYVYNYVEFVKLDRFLNYPNLAWTILRFEIHLNVTRGSLSKSNKTVRLRSRNAKVRENIEIEGRGSFACEWSKYLCQNSWMGLCHAKRRSSYRS